MDENVVRALAPGQKAEPLRPIEPFDDGAGELAGGRLADDHRRRRRRAFVDVEDFERLKALGPPHHTAHDRRALARRRPARLAQTGGVNENVAFAAAGDDDRAGERHAARGHHRAPLPGQALHDLALQLAKAALPVRAEDLGNGTALARDDHVVRLHEAPPEPAREARSPGL